METKIAEISQGGSFAAASLALMAMGILGFAAEAGATIIMPGQSAATTGTVPFVATSDSSVLSNNFTAKDVFNDVVFTGVITSQVFVDSSTGDLDFVYQFSNSANSPDAIQRLSVAGYEGFTVNADYIPSTGSAFPTTVNLDATGDIVGFTFSASAPVSPGLTTDELFVKTDASAYTLGSASLQDGGNANVVVYVPVPEPASAAIAALGFSALAMRRRKNKA